MKVKTGYHIGRLEDLARWNPLNPHGVMVTAGADRISAGLKKRRELKAAADAKAKKDA